MQSTYKSPTMALNPTVYGNPIQVALFSPSEAYHRWMDTYEYMYINGDRIRIIQYEKYRLINTGYCVLNVLLCDFARVLVFNAGNREGALIKVFI